MHPDAKTWIRFVDESAPDPERKKLGRHLEECAPCRTLEAKVRRFLEAVRTDRLLDPSPAAVRAAVAAFGQATEPLQLPDWAKSLREKVAQLVFDTFAQPDLAFAGARSGSAARRLRFEAGNLELDVLVEAQGDQRRLTAQLLQLDTPPFPLSETNYLVTAGGHLEQSGETDQHGEIVSEIRTAGEIEIRVADATHLALFRIPERAGDITRH